MPYQGICGIPVYFMTAGQYEACQIFISVIRKKLLRYGNTLIFKGGVVIELRNMGIMTLNDM